MSRPEIHDDLPDYERAGHVVFTIGEDWLTRYPEVAGHLVAALVDAQRAGLLVTRDNSTATVVKSKSDAELDAALRRAQEAWDRRERDYLTAVDHPEEFADSRDYVRRWIDAFAAEEGLVPIEWPTAVTA